MGVIPGLFTIPWGITCHSQFFSNALYPLRKSQSGAETVMFLTVSVPLCTAGLARQDETAAVCITRRQLHTVKCDQETGAEWQKGVG